jgi:hypothetical protein
VYVKQYSKSFKSERRLLPNSSYNYKQNAVYIFFNNISEAHWNLYVCHVVDATTVITWSVFDLLTCEDTVTPESYRKALIVEGAPVLSTIKYYFSLIQRGKAKKLKQLFRYMLGITANQGDNETSCRYYAAVAAVQVIQDKVPPSTHLLKGYPNVPHYTKKDMIACFKWHMNLDEGIVQGLELSQRVPPPLNKGKGELNKKPVEELKTPKRATKKMQRSPSSKQKLRKHKHVHTETPKQKRNRPKKRARTEEEEEEDDKEHDDEPDAIGGPLTQDVEPNEDIEEK